MSSKEFNVKDQQAVTKNMQQIKKDTKYKYIRREFRPLAGYFVLYVILFIGIVTILKPQDYDHLIERVFWGLITFSIAINTRRHWPAMKALLIARSRGR